MREIKREIKFRVWDIHTQKMTESFDLEEFAQDQDAEYGWGEFDLDDGNILMQYTGLKEKNGKKIYEGDIVTLRQLNLKTNLPATAIIYYKSPTFLWHNENSASNDFTEIEEVVGNIYENPEMGVK